MLRPSFPTPALSLSLQSFNGTYCILHYKNNIPLVGGVRVEFTVKREITEFRKLVWSCDSQATESWKMAQLHVTRVKREFREIVTSEEVGGRV